MIYSLTLARRVPRLGALGVRAQFRSTREEGDSGREPRGGQESERVHKSVMVREVVDFLSPQKGELLFDATAGEGGHSEALLRAAAGSKLIALDADQAAVAATAKRLAPFKKRASIIEGNFADVGALLKHAGVETLDKAVFDLGWNRGQLKSGRGFSFLHDEPLSMVYGSTPRSGFSAAQILNSWSEKVLADVFFGYGEERFARRIARAVVERRSRKPFETSVELVEVVQDAVPAMYRHGRIHPATKTFQALRIAVNDELGALGAGLTAVWNLLPQGGRMAVITFHSIEDRLVKHLFAGFVKEGGRLLSKKPLTPAREESVKNPSARSAKLRGIEKSPL
ncbi:16S rRNA (cytosine(1402)-N(4))-methyltransferase RsmH [Patescibacteria group bacterium]|nr:16S rRNA (cytosine(1402)-N(4))-methyltransferase RsmH [Patescibacteria group bacterium]